MKRTITITIEGEPVAALRPSGGPELERMWLLRQLAEPARMAIEEFQHTALRNVGVQLEVE
jgi:hypothetical protein